MSEFNQIGDGIIEKKLIEEKGMIYKMDLYVKKVSELTSSKNERVSKWKEKKICGQPTTIKEMEISEFKRINGTQNETKSDQNQNKKIDLPKTIHHKGMDDQ